ncbi:14-3-3-like protein [Aspergillus nomiae NRRL 13137]|uniref:14-3-3-like protein n=1 Tax=Aspergillus nomiae NRRL (strain ATCC 15546 / NRRL 13137 / CBS 260.88 / M93) TaxID=1509407 RepID=A0A0L1J547_ASPN3|nr:14-3-3-like protein [Aspergillus nomiae NRRL 13137]KNG86810.1 14-3-3-like protein [Aspergillus nomiae NRRL 13137]
MAQYAMHMANVCDGFSIIDPNFLALWMASSEVDQKALGNFAALTSLENPFLSAMLYRVLGLSVMLSKKLLRARRLRRLDPSRETKSLQLYHHILWLSREGLLILEEFVLPMVEGYVEPKILAYKLRASFYHIFVLFHNQPAVHWPGITSFPSNGTKLNNAPKAESLGKEPGSRFSFRSNAESISVPEQPAYSSGNVSRYTTLQVPPGLAPVQPPKASSFLLPALDYTPTATACFNHASLLAERFLPGSHPLRLSIKLEYAAYLYDCSMILMLAGGFADAAEIVGILGKMVKRGGKTSSTEGSSTASATLRGGSSRSEIGDTPATVTPVPPVTASPKTNNDLPPAVPDPTMMNPI